MIQLLALLRQLGPKAKVLLKYLVEHREEIASLIALLTELFAVDASSYGSAECTENAFVSECVAMGCDEADCMEVLSALPV